MEAYTGFEPVQSDWKSEVLPLHKYAVEGHLKLSVHNGKERIQTRDGGQFILHQLRGKIQPGMSTEAAGGWGSWIRTNGRQGLARVKVWCLTILAIPQYIKVPPESICKT